MEDLNIALQNREGLWLPRYEKTADGTHRITRVKPHPSKVQEGWTYQGVCGLCGELVDSGELHDPKG